jgi:hypothetical protein
MTLRKYLKILAGLLLFFVITIGMISIDNPIVLKLLAGSARHIGKPIEVIVYTDGKINDEIKVFYVDKYWHGREKANCYLVSLKEYDTSGMLAYFNINLDERWIGSPVGTSKKHYDFIGGHLFQSETGGYFTPFQNEIKGFNFDPQLSFTETQIKFKVPPKTLKFDSVRIELK